MRFLAGILIGLGVAGLVLAFAGDAQVDFSVHLGRTSPSPSPSAKPSPLVLHAGDNGKTVSVRVGQEVVADLGAGYSALTSSNPQVLAPIPAVEPQGPTTGAGSATPALGGGAYCGSIPPQSTGVAPSCQVPCQAAPNVRCANPCYVTPVPVPLPTAVPIPEPAPGATSRATPSPSIGRPVAPSPATGTATGGTISPYCQPICPLPVMGGASGGMPAAPSPATGNAGGGGTSTYCQNPCYCQPICMLPITGGAATASPASGSGGNGSAGTYPPASGSTAFWPQGCGQGRWIAKSAGKADIVATGGGCGTGRPCPPYAMPMQLEFVVHVVVKK